MFNKILLSELALESFKSIIKLIRIKIILNVLGPFAIPNCNRSLARTFPLNKLIFTVLVLLFHGHKLYMFFQNYIFESRYLCLIYQPGDRILSFTHNLRIIETFIETNGETIKNERDKNSHILNHLKV